MRTAHKVWSGIAATVFSLVAITDLARGTTTPPPSTSTPPATSRTETPSAAAPTPVTGAVPSTGPPEPVGELVSVIEVVDGATIEVSGGRTVRLLGLNACKVSTKGGREAKDFLEIYTPVGQQVRLVSDGPQDTDTAGRLLRRVEQNVDYRSASSPYLYDVGSNVVPHDAIGVDETNGAEGSYLDELRQRDSGERDCSGTPAARSDDGVDADGPGHVNLPDGALTGGYCRRKWWC